VGPRERGYHILIKHQTGEGPAPGDSRWQQLPALRSQVVAEVLAVVAVGP
jgi:hypothetical protein